MPSTVIVLAAAGAWICAVILMIAAYRRPRVGALVERASIAAGLAIFGTIYGVIATHTDLGLGIIDDQAAKTIIRVGVVIVVGILPAVWVVLWATGRLGTSGGSMEATLGRLEDKMDANTAISQQASDHADHAFHEANEVNQKIASQGAAILRQGEATDATAETILHTAEQVDDIHHATVDAVTGKLGEPG